MKIGVIGLGLIGGSAAMSLKNRGFATDILGYDKNELHGKEAVEIGFISQYCALEELIEKVDLILIAIPVDAAKNIILNVLDQIKEGQYVMDMGSTKGGICQIVANHPKRNQFIATHPIAGTENAGPKAAFDGLYDEKITIICNKELSLNDGVSLVENLYACLNMKVLYMDAEEHDRHIAYVSHLSHISSFVLGKTVLEIEKDEKNIFNMAGSGFASTVRLAKSSPDMWAPIFEQNAEHLSNALGAYIDNLIAFKEMIESGKKTELHELMSEVNKIRRVLNGIQLNEAKK